MANSISSTFERHWREILALKRRIGTSGGGGGSGITQLTGDVTAGPGAGSQAATLANSGVSAGTYGDAANVPQITVDVKGRITAASEVAISSGTLTIGVVIDGGASVISTGVKGFVRVPVSCTLTSWTILSIDPAVTSGSIVIDVWVDDFASYPPTNADSITNSNEPEVTTATSAEDTNLGDWTSVAITAGDVVGFNVDSVTSFFKVVLELTATVP